MSTGAQLVTRGRVAKNWRSMGVPVITNGRISIRNIWVDAIEVDLYLKLTETDDLYLKQTQTEDIYIVQTVESDVEIGPEK